MFFFVKASFFWAAFWLNYSQRVQMGIFRQFEQFSDYLLVLASHEINRDTRNIRGHLGLSPNGPWAEYELNPLKIFEYTSEEAFLEREELRLFYYEPSEGSEEPIPVTTLSAN